MIDRIGAIFSQKRVAVLVALAAILLVYTVAVAIYQAPRSTIINLDFWYQISVGLGLRIDEPDTLVNGLYPLGYPSLLAIAAQTGIDALRFGQILSWAGGLLLLLASFLLIYDLTRSIAFSVIGTVLLLLNPHFLSNAVREGNDMLAAGLQVVAVVSLWYGTTDHPSSFSKPLLILSATLLGLAYLTRYTALILLPIFIVYLLLAYYRSSRNLLQAIAITMAFFLVVTLAQWLPGWQVHHDPFYNEQAKNVWFGIYGKQDWVNNWGKVPDSISLVEVVLIDPGRFFQHWFTQLRSVFVSDRLWAWVFHVAWIVALPVWLLYQKIALSRRIFLFLVALVPVLLTSLAWIAPRFLLISFWIQAVLITWLAFRISEVSPLKKRIGLAISTGALLLLAIALQWSALVQWIEKPHLTRPEEINGFLRRAGMEDPVKVATNDPYLHATDVSARTRYEQTYSVNPYPDTIEDLLANPAADSWQYIVMDYEEGLGEYEGIRQDLVEAKSALVPLMLSEQRDIFCVVPCFSNKSEPVDLAFSNGMFLDGYRQIEEERGGSLYLYWRADHALQDSYKVSVRVLDSMGLQLLQIDNTPQSWTYPTKDWEPQNEVVDFYSWELTQPCVGCSVSIVVYDEVSLEPLLATTGSGQEVGPLVSLQHDKQPQTP